MAIFSHHGRQSRPSIRGRVNQAVSLVGNTYASFAALVAAFAFLMAIAGLFGLLCLGFLQYHAGEDADIVRALTFDYSTPVAIASVSLLASGSDSSSSLSLPWPFSHHATPKHELQHGDYLWSEVPSPPPQAKHWFGGKPQPPSNAPWQPLSAPSGVNRAFPAGREVSVSVDLQLPAHYAELFQVTGELLTAENKVLARAVRTHLAKPEAPLRRLVGTVFWFPFYFIGYYDRTHDVQFKLFNRYVEKRNMPVTKARVYLKSRNTSIGSLPPPPVHSASLRIQQKLGFLRTLLSWIRPSWTATLILGAMASGVAGFGFFTAAMALAVALILHRLSKAPAPAPKPKSGRPPSDLEPRYLPALEPPSPPSEAEDTGHIEQQHNMLPSSEDLDEEGYRSEVGEGQKGSRGIWSAATSRSPEEAGNEGEIIAEAPSEAPESLGDHGVGDSHGQAKKKDV
mmetsp:Transcript_24821/g.64017  ORF Transcript_24821/g.64017 Transcript_24821/m.64017 type:complete len:454 (-) Transcript_24821:636-1997(-)